MLLADFGAEVVTVEMAVSMPGALASPTEE
jgi:hypothetical protein